MEKEKKYFVSYNKKTEIMSMRFNHKTESVGVNIVPDNMCNDLLLEEEKLRNAEDYLLNVIT